MISFSQTLSAKCRNALLVGVALSVLLTPPSALAAEREGTVLFFSLADVQELLSHPSHFFSASLWQFPPNFAWQAQSKAVEPEGPLERNVRWGNGQGIDGQSHPGTHPLWGY